MTTKLAREILLPWIRDNKPFEVKTYDGEIYAVGDSCGDLSMGINAFTAINAGSGLIRFIPFHFVEEIFEMAVFRDQLP